MSNEIRGLSGVFVAIILIMILQIYLVKRANEHHRKKDKVGWLDLIVTSEDNRYSLSRFQIYVWTVWIVIAFCAVAFYTGALPSVPDNVAVLMGINGLTTVLSTAITDPKKIKSKQTDGERPSFYEDIFLDKNQTLDLPRTQMFIWTLVILATHVIVFCNAYRNGTPSIPDVNTGLLILMGVSNGAYLGVKAAEKKDSTA